MLDFVKAFVRQYWINLAAAGVFLVAVLRFIDLGLKEAYHVRFAWAFFGFVCVIASEEVSEWTGRYGWTRREWLQYPGSWIRLFGGVALIVATILLCCG